MGRKRVVKICAVEGCGEPVDHRRNKYCPGCREKLRAAGREKAVRRNREKGEERRRASSINRDLQKEVDQAVREAKEKFGFWEMNRPNGKAICQEGG